MKKIIAILLTIVCLMSASCFGLTAFAKDTAAISRSTVQEGLDEPELPGDTVDPEEPSEPDEPEEPEEPDENKIVAKMYICTRLVILGHAWIYIENLTDEPITVGCYTCPEGQGVSIGTAFLSRFDGPGVYYNVEARMGNKLGLFGTISNSVEINQAQLDRISEVIVDQNGWTLFTNCCLFAKRVWETVPGNKCAYGVFPFITALSIIGANEGVPDMYDPQDSQCYKQKGKGEDATIVQCSPLSLVWWVG